MTIGERVKTLRESLGMTQMELATLAQMRVGFLEEIERDQTKVSPLTLSRLALALHTSLEYLWDGSGDKDRPENDVIVRRDSEPFLRAAIWVVCIMGSFLLLALITALVSFLYFSLS